MRASNQILWGIAYSVLYRAAPCTIIIKRIVVHKKAHSHGYQCAHELSKASVRPWSRNSSPCARSDQRAVFRTCWVGESVYLTKRRVFTRLPTASTTLSRLKCSNQFWSARLSSRFSQVMKTSSTTRLRDRIAENNTFCGGNSSYRISFDHSPRHSQASFRADGPLGRCTMKI